MRLNILAPLREIKDEYNYRTLRFALGRLLQQLLKRLLQHKGATQGTIDRSAKAGNIKNKRFNNKHVTKNIRTDSYIGDIGTDVC